jgi:hypothetical protein
MWPSVTEDRETSDVDDNEPEQSEISSIHDVPSQLSFQISEIADDATERPQYWSHSLYHGPSGEGVMVSYCTTLQESQAVAQRLSQHTILGFDIEWKEGGGIYIGENVSLIQLASENEIGLFHIAMHPGSTIEELLAPALRSILESTLCIKAGFRISRDGALLAEHLMISPNSLLELDTLAKLIEAPSKRRGVMSLSKLVEIYLGGIPLDKDGLVRRSDWSLAIDSKQKDYAAADAYAGLMLFHCLNEKRLSLLPYPPLPDFATINTTDGVISSSSQDDTLDSQGSSQASLIALNSS